MADRYRGKPMSLQIGRPATIELPPRSFLGRLVGMLFDHDRTFLLPGSHGKIFEVTKDGTGSFTVVGAEI